MSIKNSDDMLDNYSDISDNDDVNDKILISETVKQISRRALNTTSSVYKINDPDIQELIFCIGAVIQSQIIADINKPNDNKNIIFDRTDFTVEQIPAHILSLESDSNEELRQQMLCGDVPSLNGMFYFLTSLKKISALLSTECHIISLIYFNRLANMGSIKVTSRNWHKLWISSVILAQKVFHDKPLRTSYFENIIPSVDKHKLRELELKVLNILDFNTNVESSLYAKYYFDLRQLHLTGTNDTKEWSIKPLSICQAKKLELSSARPNMSSTKKVRQNSRLVIAFDKMPNIQTKSPPSTSSSPPKKCQGDDIPILPNLSPSDIPKRVSEFNMNNNQIDDMNHPEMSPSLRKFSLIRGSSLKDIESGTKLSRTSSNKTYEDVTTLQDRSRYVIPL